MGRETALKYIILHFEKPTNCFQGNRILHHGVPPLACSIALRYRGSRARSYPFPVGGDSRPTPPARCWRPGTALART